MHLLLLKQKSHTTDFFCPPLRNLINASALQSFPSLSPFFAPHSLRLLFHLSFFPSLYNPFFHTQSQNMAFSRALPIHFSIPRLFPVFCIFTFSSAVGSVFFCLRLRPCLLPVFHTLLSRSVSCYVFRLPFCVTPFCLFSSRNRSDKKTAKLPSPYIFFPFRN